MSKHLSFHIVQPDGESSPETSASIGIRPTSLSLSSFYDSLLALLHGDVPPNDREETAGQRHPDNAHGRGHARYVIPEVQFGEEESERRGLHGRLDGHGAGFHLPEPCELGQPVTDDAPEEVEEEDGDLRILYARAIGGRLCAFAKRKHTRRKSENHGKRRKFSKRPKNRDDYTTC